MSSSVPSSSGSSQKAMRSKEVDGGVVLPDQLQLQLQLLAPACAGELTPGCLLLFPLASGDVRQQGSGGPAPGVYMPPPSEAGVSEVETGRRCLELFPRAPGDVRNHAGAAASKDVSCEAAKDKST